jgi:hypothetical protein
VYPSLLLDHVKVLPMVMASNKALSLVEPSSD